MQPRCLNKALQVSRLFGSRLIFGKVGLLRPPFAWWLSSERDGGRTCSQQRLGEQSLAGLCLILELQRIPDVFCRGSAVCGFVEFP